MLVGNYPTADDAKAQEMLHTLKYAKPQCLEVKDGKPTHQTLTGWRLAQQQVYEMIGSEKKKLGPMRHAFITPNPLLPPDYFTQQAASTKRSIALNKGVPYSLLECPGKYTVQVATFKGNAIIKQDDIQDIEDGERRWRASWPPPPKKADALDHVPAHERATRPTSSTTATRASSRWAVSIRRARRCPTARSISIRESTESSRLFAAAHPTRTTRCNRKSKTPPGH